MASDRVRTEYHNASTRDLVCTVVLLFHSTPILLVAFPCMLMFHKRSNVTVYFRGCGGGGCEKGLC